MKNTKMLSDLVSGIKYHISKNSLTAKKIDSTIENLESIGFKKYEVDKFPELINTHLFDGDTPETPSNLAEALLWKMGKWTTYKNFTTNFNQENLVVSDNGGIVFSAFAKHLQDPDDSPIYDQHAIRALWAVGNLTSDEIDQCKNLLFNGSSKWKSVGSGDDGSCYRIFVKHIAHITKENHISHQQLDKILMPLGQAIKKSTKIKKQEKDQSSDYKRFQSLCFPGVHNNKGSTL